MRIVDSSLSNDCAYLERDIAAFREENARLIEERQRLESAFNVLEQRLAELEAEAGLDEQVRQYDQGIERNFSYLFDASPAALLLTNHHGDVLMLNQAGARFLQQPRDALIGQNLRKFLKKESRYELVKLLKACATSEDKLRAQRVFSLLDERLFSLTLVRLDHQQASGYYLLSPLEISLPDISAQSLRLSASILDQMREGVMITSAKGVILKVNQAFAEITGYSEQEVLGKTPALLHSGRHSVEFYRALWAEIQHHGWWAGEIWNRRKSGEVFPEWLQISRIHDPHSGQNFYVATFSDITDRKAHQHQLDRLAFYDILTGLPNRALLSQALDAQLSRLPSDGSALLAVLFIDLDKFKEVNDHYGHAEGDEVLRQATQRIMAHIRENDLASRIGGDEFVVVLARLQQCEHAFEVANGLLNTLAEPFVTTKGKHYLSASIGIAFSPRDGDSVEDLMRRADSAMYRAKNGGRNGVQVFEAQDEARLIESNLILRLIRQAIEAPQQVIQMHYQPIFAAGRITKPAHYEALIRLRDSEGKLVMPGTFIELAEQHGLIGQLGMALFVAVCADVCREKVSAQVKIAINLSPVQCHSEGLVNALVQAAHAYDLDLSRFHFEVTETATMQNLHTMLQTLQQLKAQGAQIMLDDFGTGYASLSMLKNLPVDVLKIDQGFVRELMASPETQTLVKAMIAMADALGLRVVAEGVETQAQYDWLVAQGAHYLQGYWLGRPQATF